VSGVAEARSDAEASVRGPLDRHDVARLLGWHRAPVIPLAVVALVVALVPLVTANSYILDLLILILIYAVLNQAWNLTLGMTGAWNFGQLALFAIGGYGAGISEARLGISPWLAMLVGALLACVANGILCIPSMRLRGIYVALLTFSFGEVVRLVIINDSTGLTGGVFGLTNITGPFDNMSAQAGQRAMYWLVLVACIITALVIQRVMNSPYGIAFQGLRDSSRYALSLGISMRVYYVAATTLSAFLSGIAGALYAFHYSTISPSVMGLTPLSLLVLMILVGGMATVSGPIVGTFVVMVLTELLRGTGQWRLLILGIVLLAILMLQPTGVVKLFARLYGGLQEWMNADQAPRGGPQAVVESPGDQSATLSDASAEAGDVEVVRPNAEG
jgi:branched-chain amino acid transport system permease protein